MAGPVEPPIERRPQYSPGDPAHLRVSDEDRHKVAEILREAAGEGRIDLDELDERLEAAYAAKTYADLVPITLDLPVAGGAAAPVQRRSATPQPVTAASHTTSIAVMSGATRRGVWQVGERYTAFAFCGGIDLDLREAIFSARETVIYANAVWGGIDVIVNEHTNVIVEGVGIMGGFDQGRARVTANLTPDSPIVRVKGVALMAGVTVTRKAMPGDEPRGILRHRHH
jgi:hypothetical protein